MKKSIGLRSKLKTRFSSSKKLEKAYQNLQPDSVEEIRQLFQKYDRDNSGTIDAKELAKAVGVLLGCPLSKQNAELMLERVNTDKSGSVSFDEFKHLTALVITLKKQFDEADKDKSKTLTASEMVPLLNQPPNSYKFSLKTAEGFIKMFDDDESGTISYQEYFNLSFYLRELEHIHDERLSDVEEGRQVQEWSHYLKGVLGKRLASDKKALEQFQKLDKNKNFEPFAETVIRVWVSSLSGKQKKGDRDVLKVRKNIRERRKRKMVRKSPSFAKSEKASQNLQPDSLSSIRTLFDRYDRDHSGKIDSSELASAMGALLGCTLNKQNAELMLDRVDTDRSGTINFDEFKSLTGIVISFKKQFDEADKDNSKTLSAEEMLPLLNQPPNNYKFTQKTAVNFIQTFDDDKTKWAISYVEFINLAFYLHELEHLHDERVNDLGEGGGPKEWSYYLVGVLGEKLANDPKILEQFRPLDKNTAFEPFAEKIIAIWRSSAGKGASREALKVRKNLRERQPRRRIHSSPSFRKDETAMEKLQPGMMDDVRKLFNQFDKDRSGQIDAKELASAVGVLISCSLNKQNAELMLDRVDTDQSGTVSFEEFKHLTGLVITLKEQFDAADKDKSKTLTASEMIPLLNQPPNSYKFSLDTVKEFIKMFDDDASGTISYQEYFNLAFYLRELEHIHDERVNDMEEGGGVKEWPHYLSGVLGKGLAKEEKVLEMFSPLEKNTIFEPFAAIVIGIWGSPIGRSANRDEALKVRTSMRERRPPKRSRPAGARVAVKHQLTMQKEKAFKEFEVRQKTFVAEKKKKKKSDSDLWCDPDFPANDSILPPKGRLGGWKQCVWLRPQEIIAPTGKEAKLFVDGSEEGDVMQGILGDCWFLSAISVLATTEDLIQEMFVAVAPEKGMYRVRFWKDGEWKYVDIDDRLPCSPDTRFLLFASCREQSEFWVPLLEKAYAKLHGSYYSLEGGSTTHGLKDMTGEATELIDLEDQTNPMAKDPNLLWGMLLKCMEESFLLGCSISMSGVAAESVSAEGLLYKHAYGILDVQEIQGHKLIRIRNPWGKQEWTGRWSDESREWTPALMRHFDYDFGDDGTFFMCLEDFHRNFNKIHVLRMLTDDVGEKWEKKSFRSAWTKKPERAGGCLNHPELFLKNPQFALCARQNSRIFVSLSQPCLRYSCRKKPGSHNSKKYSAIGINVLKHSSTTERMIALSGQPIAKSRYSPTRDQTLEFAIEANQNYIIIPTTFEPGVLGEFELLVYVQNGAEVVTELVKEPEGMLMQTGEWKGLSAGGCTNHGSWIHNPQFSVVLSQESSSSSSLAGKMTISLEQLGDSAPLPVGFYLFNKRDSNPPGVPPTAALRQISQNKTRVKTDFSRNKKISMEAPIANLAAELPLTIVPSTFDPGMERKFKVEVVFTPKGGSPPKGLSLCPVQEFQATEVVNGKWQLPDLAGGCANHSTWLQNPLYLLKFKNGAFPKGHIIMTLAHKKGPGGGKREPSGIDLFEKVPSGGKGKGGILGTKIVSSQFSPNPVVEADVDGSKEYVLLLATFNPGIQGDFLLSVFSTSHSMSLSPV